MKRWLLVSSVLAMAACGAPAKEEPVRIITTGEETPDETPDEMMEEEEEETKEPAGLALLGDNQHALESVDFSVVAESDTGLTIPRDLAFHPDRAELWVVNLGDNSTVVFDNPATGSIEATKYAGLGKDHFMARPSSLAFSDNGNFATSQEEDEKTQGEQTPADFMGATLWTSDRSIYDGGHGGHLDMLHNSPNGAGIAWERDNRFWLFDGYHQSITMYDFHEDHGPGGADHSDGEVVRYVEGEVSYVPDVPSHLEFNHDDGLLYIADTGNNRIATLDPTVGEPGGRIYPNYDGGAQYGWNGGVIETFADGADVMLEVPSGLAIHDGMIFVSDNARSRVVAVDMEGNLVDYLDLAAEVAPGGLMGIAFAADGSLYLVDAKDDRILRVAARAGSNTQ